MDASEYFIHIRQCSARIADVARTLSALEQCEGDMSTWRTRGSGGGHGVGTTSDPTASMACDRMGLPDHIADTRREYEALADEIAACGELLETVGREVSKDAADALELWAIDRAGTWSEVAEEMGVSRRTVARLRDQAFAWLNHHMVFANHNCPRNRLYC